MILWKHWARRESTRVEVSIVFIAVNCHWIMSGKVVVKVVNLPIYVDRKYFAWAGLGCLFGQVFAISVFAKMRFNYVWLSTDTFFSSHMLFKIKS